jgi:hypothetical protein
VIQGGQHFRLPLETDYPGRVGGECIRQHLQRDIAFEPGVTGAKDLAHAACANGRKDFIWSHFRAGRERHDGQIILP